MAQPTLFSQRLELRPFDLGDASAVQFLAGERAIADTTVNIPHPYEDGMAEDWIADHGSRFDAGKSAVFAIVDRLSAELIGAIGLEIDSCDGKAELGYWVGAVHFSRNPASGRVMQKVGMTHEGRVRQGVKRWDAFEDLEMYGLLRSEWLVRNKPS